jgi:DNA-3-methyladenine glycosylase II
MANSVTDNWKAATRTLSTDPVMAKIIRCVGPCRIQRRRDYYPFLCKAIFNQQLSGAIASLLFSRFCEQFPNRRPTPARTLELLDRRGEKIRRACGLSRQKQKYIVDLARHFANGKIRSRHLARMSDDQIIECLTNVHGIGRWTAEMFLIFVLNRPDVWPVDDLGVREAFKRAYSLRARLKPRDLTDRAEHWRPYRSVATWYLWRSLDVESKANKNRKRPAPAKRAAKNPRDKQSSAAGITAPSRP